MSATEKALDPHIQFERNGHVAVITLSRPEKLNAITPSMSESIVQCAASCSDDDEIRAVILTGTGAKAFCAGSDIGELDTYQSPWAHRMKHDHCDAVSAITKPVICAVNGLAFGGGLEMALCCDIRICTANARFAAPEIKLGWVGGGGMAVYLCHAIGSSRSARMLYTGDPIDATTAGKWGLVDEVFDDAEAMLRSARVLADTIAERAPIAAQTAKLNLHAAANMPLDQAVMYERDLRTICFYTEDAAEGKTAFREKRPPKFRKI